MLLEMRLMVSWSGDYLFSMSCHRQGSKHLLLCVGAKVSLDLLRAHEELHLQPGLLQLRQRGAQLALRGDGGRDPQALGDRRERLARRRSATGDQTQVRTLAEGRRGRDALPAEAQRLACDTSCRFRCSPAADSRCMPGG